MVETINGQNLGKLLAYFGFENLKTRTHWNKYYVELFCLGWGTILRTTIYRYYVVHTVAEQKDLNVSIFHLLGG